MYIHDILVSNGVEVRYLARREHYDDKFATIQQAWQSAWAPTPQP